MKPFESPMINRDLESLQINVSVKDTTLLYTPVLTREKIEKVYGITAGHPLVRNSAYDHEQFRVQVQVAVQLNNLTLQSNPKEKSNIFKCESTSVYFLSDTKYEKWPSWILYAKPEVQIGGQMKNVRSYQELHRKGFVPILAVSDFNLIFK